MKKSIVVTTVLAICAMLLGGVTMLASPAQAASLPHPMGLIPNPTTHIPSTAPKAANLPASADLRQYDVPVGNQGSVNSCTAWAVGYDLMGWYANHAGQNVQAFSPMYVYSQLNGGEDQGADIGLALALASAQGVDTQDDYLPQGNYNWSTQPTAAQKTNAAKYRLTGSNNLFNVWAVPAGTVIDKRTPIKTDLAAGKPVAIGMTVPASFETWNQTNLNVAYTDTNVATSVGRHAMLVVAYDANGLIIQNSWSTSWGAAGYFRLSWAAADVLINEAWDASGYAPTANTPVVKVTNTSSTAVSTLTFTPAGGSQTLMAPSNTAWKASSNASWLTVAPQTGFGLISATGVNATLTLTASSNTTSAARTGVVTFTTTGTSPAVSTSVTVTQQTSAPTPTPTPAPTLTVSPASWSPAVAGASTSVTVTSNASWSVSSSATWVSLSKTTGTGNGSVSLTAQANTSTAARTATVTLKTTSGSPAVTHTVSVTQAAAAPAPAPTLTVSPSSWSPVAAGASTSVTVTSNASWSVSSSATWVSLSKTTGTGNGSVSLTAQANTSTAARSATVTVKTTTGSPQVTRTVSVTQAAATPAPTLTVSASSWNPASSSTSTSVTVTSNSSWSASSSASWVTLSRTTGTGSGSVTLTVQANTSTAARSATVTFKTTSGSPVVTRTVAVTQAAASPVLVPTLTLSGSSWAPAAAGASTSVNVTSNTAWSVSSSATWVTVSASSGSNNKSVTLTAGANTATTARSATVTFHTTSGSPQVTRTLSVSQPGKAAPAPTLVLSGSSWAASVTGATASVSVTSNTAWSVSSNASWVTLSRTTGSGNLAVSLTAQANTSTAARSATVTFKTTSGSPQVTRTVSVTQPGHPAVTPTLTLSGDGWFPLASAVKASGQLTSNTSWSAASSASWLTVSASSGTGNTSLVFAAQANTTNSIRTATVTFKTTSGSPQVTRTVSVVQAGLDCGGSLSSYCTWNISSWFSGTIDVPGDQDWYRFTAPTTGVYTFTSSRPSVNSLADPYGSILQSNGRVLAWDDDSAGDHQFRIRVSLTAGQAYFLAVQGYNRSDTGFYSVTATRG